MIYAIIYNEVHHDSTLDETTTIWYVDTLNDHTDLMKGFTYRGEFKDYYDASDFCEKNGYAVFLTLGDY
jgi:hypothetical protein